MLKDLIKAANRLDSFGLAREADFLDGLIRKIAEGEDPFALDDSLNPEVKSDFASRLLRSIESGISGVSEFLKNSVEGYDARWLMKMHEVSSFVEIRKAIRSLVGMSGNFSSDDRERLASLNNQLNKEFSPLIDKLMKLGGKVRGFHGATGIARYTIDSNSPGSSKKFIDDPLARYLDFLNTLGSTINDFDQKYVLQEKKIEESLENPPVTEDIEEPTSL